MNKHEVTTYVAAILTTALETEPDLFPESMAYLATGGDIGKWEVVRHVLVDCEWVTIKGNVIQLTDKGRDMAVKVNAALIH
jgi:hypothetical protein